MSKKKLPVGIEDFEEIRREGFYYVDKTGLIRDLLNNWGKVNLFTRPRRFGKTLNMSMLKCFFEIGTDRTLFDGLAISQETELCEEYMGKYPVIYISLKGVDGLDFEEAYRALCQILRSEMYRLNFLLDSDKVFDNAKSTLKWFLNEEETGIDVRGSLKLLTSMLYQHYDQRVILLIDEYDVPLDKAFQNGYYEEMAFLLGGMFEYALKTNFYLEFAVLMGRLRIPKGNDITGLNNIGVNSIAGVRYDKHFGFTEEEVQGLLEDYHLEEEAEIVKAWYGGYRFGNTTIYCPWDVISYADMLCANPHAEPEAFWINTSGNELVKRFIDRADKTTQNEIERLIAGGAIEKAVRLDLTYNEIDASIDNLWSVLFTTGYLTQRGRASGGIYKLVIPNREVREIFVLQIQEWFRKVILADSARLNCFCSAFCVGDTQTIQEMIQNYLWDSIIVEDMAIQMDQENFYHGLLLGLLRSEANWLILSNAESGDGFSDILIEPEDPDVGIVIEVKYASSIAALDGACEEALTQIREKRYDERLRNDGRTEVLSYGIAFCKKRCKVVCGN